MAYLEVRVLAVLYFHEKFKENVKEFDTILYKNVNVKNRWNCAVYVYEKLGWDYEFTSFILFLKCIRDANFGFEQNVQVYSTADNEHLKYTFSFRVQFVTGIKK